MEILHQCKHQFYFIFNTRFLLNEISGANFSLEMCLYIHALNSECIMEGEKKSSHPYKTFWLLIIIILNKACTYSMLYHWALYLSYGSDKNVSSTKTTVGVFKPEGLKNVVWYPFTC